jgi:hypothetical protein
MQEAAKTDVVNAWLTGQIGQAIENGEAIDATALRFLLRRYVASQRDDLADTVGLALARALTDVDDGNVTDTAGWLTLFGEAASISTDERLTAAATTLLTRLRAEWGSATGVEHGTRSVEACLSAAHLWDAQDVVAPAIDELERVVGGAYRPGEGIAHTVGPRREEHPCLADHLSAASALLTAFAVTGRLPYSMLAEELIQFARRTMWDPHTHTFRAAAKPFLLNCEAARVLSRLAALHQDDGYRQAAVFSRDADYAADARRVLVALESEYRDQGRDGAAYGLALMELQG